MTTPVDAPSTGGRFFAGAVDEKLIALHWDDVLRLTASVRTVAIADAQAPGASTLDRTD